MSGLFPPPGVKVWSVSDLTHSIKGLLEEAHGQVWVEGEVSNLARPASGHLYLTLKDQNAPLKTVIYRGVALRMKFDLRDGMGVIARGRLTVYMPRGEYQLQVEELHPKGIGPLELAFRQLKEKLSVRGYFDPARKKRLPRFPGRICLVTSGTGSAVRDMLEILGRRWPAAEVWVCPVRVQGEGAAEEIARAIHFLNRVGGPDVLIVGRGGGSLEDLWPFNEEVVAEAIYSSRIPVVTGVGHEDDLTIADLVADVRALTPSEAAERVAPNRALVIETLETLEGKCRTLLARKVELARSRLEALVSRPCLRMPLERIREEERKLDTLSERLLRAVRRRCEIAQQKLSTQSAKLESLSPLNVLQRGYSLTRKEGSPTLLRSVDEVRPGDRLLTRLHSGQVCSVVESIEVDDDTTCDVDAPLIRKDSP